MRTAAVIMRTIQELRTLRGVLDGSVSPEEAAGGEIPMGFARPTEAGNRRLMALGLVNRLGAGLAKVLESVNAADQSVLEMVGGADLLPDAARPEPPPERGHFGFRPPARPGGERKAA